MSWFYLPAASDVWLWCATSQSLGTLPILFLKESSPRTSSDRIYICHSCDLRHQWLYKWITLSQSKTLVNQGPGNVTKKICSGELMTKRLEDRESESDLLVSHNVSLMFYIPMSLLLQCKCICPVHSTHKEVQRLFCLPTSKMVISRLLLYF